MIRQEGGLVPTTWERALGAVLSGLRGATPLAGILSGRNTNEEAFLFAKLMKRLSQDCALEVLYQERELTEVQRILMSPDRSPNFRGAREMGVSSSGGFEPLMRKLFEGHFSGAYVVGEDLLGMDNDKDWIRRALQKLSFLVVQDIRMTETAQLALRSLMRSRRKCRVITDSTMRRSESRGFNWVAVRRNSNDR